MRYSLLTCLMLVWLATAQAGDPKPMTVTAGQQFKITLQYNASTGYQWVLAKAPDAKLVKLLGTEYKRLDTKLIGAGGDMVWTFQALAEGKTQIGLDYVRPWEKGQKPAQATNFVVVIQAPKAPAKTNAPAHGA
jgi:inhibitor of cysteine peptidase